MKDIEFHILNKCGWKDKQLGFLRTMVHNITNDHGDAISDIIYHRTTETITIYWFIPNKNGDKISLVYSLTENKILKEKSDPEIHTDKELYAFLDNISIQ